MKDQTGFWSIDAIETDRARSNNPYLEFLRIPAMSAGVYSLAAGSVDTQSPHGQDELYYVVRGKARMRAGAVDRPIAEGSVIFVGANVEHKFHDIEAALTVLVFFAPAEVES